MRDEMVEVCPDCRQPMGLGEHLKGCSVPVVPAPDTVIKFETGVLDAEEVLRMHADGTLSGPLVDPKRTVLLTVWDELSHRCQEDLKHCRAGSIVRCTLEDFEHLRSVVVLPDTKLEERVAYLEEWIKGFSESVKKALPAQEEG